MCIDHMQLFPSPCSDHCPNINARFVHDPTTPISTVSRDSYSVIQGRFCNAPWRRAGELEPKDPTTGRSVLYVLLEECTRGNKRFTKCRLCNSVFTRADRAITHLRHKHLDHRPFRCGGACGTKGWYEDFRCVFLGQPDSSPARNASIRKRIWLPMLNPRWPYVTTGQYSLFSRRVPLLKRDFDQ